VVPSRWQATINDGNHYEAINDSQNLFGGRRRWRRLHPPCLSLAAGGVISAWPVNYHFLDGWFTVAGFLAIIVPCATMITAVDHFMLPRLFGSPGRCWRSRAGGRRER
jgi:hypothetical protein